LADSRFSAASATGDEAKDPKQIWFRLTYTANAQGSVVGGKVGYSNDYSVKTLFGL
jgi:hypothetical protein